MFIGQVIKDKWRNKRDDYRKKRNKMRSGKKSGSGAKSATIKGAFFDQLSFLDPFIEDNVYV